MRKWSSRHPSVWRGATLAFSVLGISPQAAEILVAEPALLVAQPVTQQQEAKPAKLTPAQRQLLDTAVTAATERKRQRWAQQTQSEIREICKATGADQKLTENLEKSVTEASAESLRAWSTSYAQGLSRQLPNDPEQFKAMLLQLSAMSRLTNDESFGGVSEPLSPETWSAVLDKLLTPEQGLAWKAVQTRRKEDLEKEIHAAMATMEVQDRQGRERLLHRQIVELKRTLELTPERGVKLEELGKVAVDRYVEAWRKAVEPMVRRLEVASRRAILQGNTSYSATQPEDEPTNQSVWKEGLAQMLTPAEQKRLEAARQEHVTQRLQAMSQMLVMEMDREVALSETQRQNLRPIAERLVKGETSFLVPEGGMEINFSCPRQTFLHCAAKATDEELQKILDPAQLKHWRSANKPAISMEELRSTQNSPEGKAADPKLDDPDAVEQGISDLVVKSLVSPRARLFKKMLLQVDDIDRTIHLPGPVRERLLTAARGSAEATLARLRESSDSMLRSRFANAAPGDILQQGAGTDFGGQQIEVASENGQSIWKETLEAELTPAQQAAWKTTLEARKTFREQAIVSLILAELDRKVTLNAVQQEKLRPLLNRNMAESNFTMFSFSDGGSWYSQSYSLFMPLAGVEETDLSAVLDKEQMDGWKSSNEYSHSTSYWQNNRDNAKANAR